MGGYGSGMGEMGGYGSGMGGMGGYGSGMGGMGGYGGMCCEMKYVKGASDPDMDGVYVLLQQVAYWDVPEWCNSPCVYAKKEDMEMMKEEMYGGMENETGMGSGYGMENGTEGSGMGMRQSSMEGSEMGSGYGSMGGYDSEEEMMMMMMMKVQKYCFKPSKNAQSMCKAPGMGGMGGGYGSGYGSGSMGGYGSGSMEGYGSGSMEGSGYGSGSGSM